MIAMATLALSPEVLASKDSTCPMCPKPIVKGETYIQKVDGCDKGWMHAQCASAYARHCEELKELNRELDGAEGAGKES